MRRASPALNPRLNRCAAKGFPGWVVGKVDGGGVGDVGREVRVELVKRVRLPSIAIYAGAGSHLIVGTLSGATVSLHPLPGTRGDAMW